jgi:hypothetical protein
MKVFFFNVLQTGRHQLRDKAIRAACGNQIDVYCKGMSEK